MVAATAGTAGAAATGAPTRPPANIEDFLWNIHTVLAAQPGQLPIDQLKDVYSKHLGHKCAIERFLVVGEGGLGATLKRIPHIVTLSSDNGSQFVKAAQPADITKQQLIEADAAYRRELIKKNAAAKAKAAAGKQPAAAATAAPKAAAPTAAAGAAEQPKAAAGDAQAKRDAEAKRPAEGPAGADPKRARTDSNDADTLARMLVQGVVRVLQNRQRAGKGPLPVSELEEEFKALWKVPFNLQQAGETDAVTFLQKWQNKVDVTTEGGVQVVQLCKKGGQDKPKEPAAKKAAAPATTAAASKSSAPPAAARTAPATGTAAKAAPAPTGPPAAAKSAPPAEAPAAAAKNGPSIPKRAGGPTRPPASIEDFLWNIHSVIEAYGAPLPIDQLKDAYSKHLGHKCAIERFLVVGDGGFAATLKRIPHIVTIAQEKDNTVLKPTLPAGTTKENLIAADHSYRKQLQQKNQAAKEAAASKAKQPPAAAAAQAVAPSPAAAPAAPAAPAKEAAPAAPAATAVKAAAAAPAAAPAAPAQGQKRPSEGGEADAKKPRGEDADTLARMLVQGIVRVLQNRQKDGKGPLAISNLEEEFKALWKVPFNLQQAGETDTVTFLNKWPNKVEVTTEGGEKVVGLAKKAAEKAKAGAPASTKASTPGAAAVAKTGASAPAAKPAPGPPKAAATASSEAAGTSAAAAAGSTGTAASGRPGTAQAKDTSASASVAPARSSERGDGAAATGASQGPPSRAYSPTNSASQRKEAGAPRTLAQVREEAKSMLQAMQDMLRRQEVLVSALQQMSSDSAA